jgi:developmental checkpoint coupling sporulation initiation to replication initiation
VDGNLGETKMHIIPLSDHLLIESYNKAIELQLDSQFIDLLKKEIEKRDLSYK